MNTGYGRRSGKLKLTVKGPNRNVGVARRQANRRPISFVVFGNQRTGSTLIATKLTSHPRIICYEEVFLPWVDSSPSLRDWLDAAGRPQWLRAVPGVRTSFLDTLFDVDRLPDDVGAVGFKVMYNQLSLWPTFAYVAPRGGELLLDRSLRNWLSVNEVIIVHTVRRNRLKVLVSHELAAQSGHYHSRDSESGNSSVAIPLLGLKARLRRIETAERVARATIRGLPTIEIVYEDYVSTGGADQDARLCAALGQPVVKDGLSSPLRKVSSDNLRDTVKNYDQVAAYLSGTRFEQFLT
jgi:LPS sulfotransferase NodH